MAWCAILKKVFFESVITKEDEKMRYSSYLRCVVVLACFGLFAGCDELKVKEGGQIVAIGDSITQDGGYLKNIEKVLTSQYPDLKIPAIINAGISGQKAEELAVRFDKDVVQKKPALVIISVGINDVWHRLTKPHDMAVLDAYKANVVKMVDAAQVVGIRVLLCTPTIFQEYPDSEGNKRLALYAEAIKKIAEEKKCLTADLRTPFIEGIANRSPDMKGYDLTRDGVHMNAKGDWLMAEGILKVLGVPAEKMKAARSESL